jgi:hypothetical protein
MYLFTQRRGNLRVKEVLAPLARKSIYSSYFFGTLTVREENGSKNEEFSLQACLRIKFCYRHLVWSLDNQVAEIIVL